MKRRIRAWIAQHITKRYPIFEGGNCGATSEWDGACMLALGHWGDHHHSMFAEPRS